VLGGVYWSENIAEIALAIIHSVNTIDPDTNGKPTTTTIIFCHRGNGENISQKSKPIDILQFLSVEREPPNGWL
jgi:hypothetical protein